MEWTSPYQPQRHQSRFHASPAVEKLFLGGVGAGKALALDTPIPTPDGWSTMGDLAPGSRVFDMDGNPTLVVRTTHVMRHRSCYAVTFDDGSTIVADADHRWLTWDKTARKAEMPGRRVNGDSTRADRPQCRPRAFPAVRTTAQIAATLTTGKRGTTNHSVPTCMPLRGPYADVPIPPYVLGIWLGNGVSTAAAISLSDRDIEVLDNIRAEGIAVAERPGSRDGECGVYTLGAGERRRSPIDGRFRSSGGMHAALANLGLIGGRELRRVPGIYMRASSAQRLGLLQGLMDADGWSMEGTNRVEFSTMTPALGSAVYELAASLGMKPTLATGRAMLDGKDCGEKCRVTWSTRTAVFRLARKRLRCNPAASQAPRTSRRYIVSVNAVPSVPVKCIEVASPTHTYLAGRAMVPTHNSLCGVHEAMFLAQDNPDCDGAIVSPTYPMLRDVIVPLWEAWVPGQLYTHKKSDQVIVWHPTGRRIFLRSADRPGRLSGLNVAWVWLDEAALLRTFTVWRILQARIRDPRAKRRCLYTTTTPLGMNWLIREFRKTGPTRHVVRARTAENLHLPDDFEPGLRATYGDEYAAQYLDAVVLELAGAVWPYLPRVHSALTADEMRSRVVMTFGAVDWGFTNPACVLAGGVDGDGRWYLLDCWYKRGVNRDGIAQQAKLMNAKWNIRTWWTDHDPEGVGHMRTLTAEERAQGLRPCTVQLAEKSVEQGVQYTRTLFPCRSDGQPRIYVAPDLKDWQREVDGYFFPEDAEEPKAQFGDHAMDATRYLAYSHSIHHAGRATSGGVRLPDLSQENQWGGL